MLSKGFFINLIPKYGDEYLSLKNIDTFYFNFKDILNNMSNIANLNCEKFAVFPTIVRKNYEKLIITNIEKVSKIVDGFVISSIGQLKLINYLHNNHKNKLIANYTLNTFNTYAIDLLKNLNFSKVILSPELTKNQINNLGGDLEREVIAYGKTCVMNSNHCPIGSLLGSFNKNSSCKKICISNNFSDSDRFYLRDRLNMDFLILPDSIDCTTKIFNPKITSIETSTLNVDSIRIDVIDESPSELQKIINLHKKGQKISGENYTNGHFKRSV